VYVSWRWSSKQEQPRPYRLGHREEEDNRLDRAWDECQELRIQTCSELEVEFMVISLIHQHTPTVDIGKDPRVIHAKTTDAL
jgi:hypothetical protein